MALAADAGMPQVRAVAMHRLERLTAERLKAAGDLAEADVAHQALLARDIRRFLERPASPYAPPAAPSAPPGAPIGDPAMDWLGGGAHARPESSGQELRGASRSATFRAPAERRRAPCLPFPISP